MANRDCDTFARIEDWFGRHRRDYDPAVASPPKVWSEHFASLLDLVRAGAERIAALERKVADLEAQRHG